MTTTILDFLPYYPTFEEDDEQIYSKKEFNELKLSRHELKPKNKVYQKHQELLSKILSSYTLYDKLLLFHGMGTGKTGVAFATSERILAENFGINKVFVLTMSNDVLDLLKGQLVNTYGKDVATGGSAMADAEAAALAQSTPEEFRLGCWACY